MRYFLLNRCTIYSKQVITVGGSYPGFLSAMMRFLHPDLVDIGYAASAPLKMYSKGADPNAYYDKVTEMTRLYSPECPGAVKAAAMEIVNTLLKHNDVDHHHHSTSSTGFRQVAARMDICVDTIPDYITSNKIFARELSMILIDNNADINMDWYPPSSNTTTMAQMCRIFLDAGMDSYQKMGAFFKIIDETTGGCFDLRSQLPAGPNATISTADWSGAGPGEVGRAWEYQLCTEQVTRLSVSPHSMFPAREWTLDWLTKHCQSRFGVTPEPHKLVEQYHFDDLIGHGASRILFTNGLHDGWSVYSHLQNLSSTVLALNFPNGAHHSDLQHIEPGEHDTDDIQQGYIEIASILKGWLEDIKGVQYSR